MEHIAWKGRIKPGCKAEYQCRHAEIWPEMVEVLKAAGICNYSIFYCNDELFGYYECAKGVAYAEKKKGSQNQTECAKAEFFHSSTLTQNKFYSACAPKNFGSKKILQL